MHSDGSDPRQENSGKGIGEAVPANVVAHKDTKSALYVVQEYAEAIVQTMPDALLVLDTDLRVKFANDALRASEEQKGLLLESINDHAILALDEEGRMWIQPESPSLKSVSKSSLRLAIKGRALLRPTSKEHRPARGCDASSKGCNCSAVGWKSHLCPVKARVSRFLFLSGREEGNGHDCTAGRGR